MVVVQNDEHLLTIRPYVAEVVGFEQLLAVLLDVLVDVALVCRVNFGAGQQINARRVVPAFQ